MGGFWSTFKIALGFAPPPVPATTDPGEERPMPAEPVPPTQEAAPAAVSAPPAAPLLPHPSLAGVINANRFAAGDRTYWLIGAPVARPKLGGVLNPHKHDWRTFRTGVINSERYEWLPPFPRVINSGRYQWKVC